MKLTGSDFAIAAAINFILFRQVAVAIGLPGWTGTTASALAMGIAVDPKSGDQVRKIASAASAPGALAVQLLHSKQVQQLKSQGCDCPGKTNASACKC